MKSLVMPAGQIRRCCRALPHFHDQGNFSGYSVAVTDAARYDSDGPLLSDVPLLSIVFLLCLHGYEDVSFVS